MNLTRDYKTVTALFGGSGKGYFDEPDFDPSWISKKFQVGPIVYKLHLIGNGSRKTSKSWHLSFEYYEMVGSNKELMNYFSELYGRQVSLKELRKIEKKARTDPYGELGLGKSSQVFGEMVLILKQFIQKYNPKCFSFGSSQKRVGIYNKMFSRIFSTPHWEKFTEPAAGGDIVFSFCRNGK